ncbi:MAG: cytochrome P460 family protein [Anaerolineae bacterium]|nr:cytochrome P460 family protein [Anaerolineae bacterium]
MTKILCWLLLGIALAGCATTTEATTPGVPFPANYQDTFVRYAQVERPDGTIRDLYISPNAVGRGSLPDGTTILIEGYHAAEDDSGEYLHDADGHYIKGEPFEMLHVIQKRGNWTDADFPGETRTGNWNFGSFEAATGERFEEDLLACFNCHNATPRTDFIYSRPQLNNYARTDLLQYFYCDVTGRLAC